MKQPQPPRFERGTYYRYSELLPVSKGDSLQFPARVFLGRDGLLITAVDQLSSEEETTAEHLQYPDWVMTKLNSYGDVLYGIVRVDSPTDKAVVLLQVCPSLPNRMQILHTWLRVTPPTEVDSKVVFTTTALTGLPPSVIKDAEYLSGVCIALKEDLVRLRAMKVSDSVRCAAVTKARILANSCSGIAIPLFTYRGDKDRDTWCQITAICDMVAAARTAATATLACLQDTPISYKEVDRAYDLVKRVALIFGAIYLKVDINPRFIAALNDEFDVTAGKRWRDTSALHSMCLDPDELAMRVAKLYSFWLSTGLDTVKGESPSYSVFVRKVEEEILTPVEKMIYPFYPSKSGTEGNPHAAAWRRYVDSVRKDLDEGKTSYIALCGWFISLRDNSPIEGDAAFLSEGGYGSNTLAYSVLRMADTIDVRPYYHRAEIVEKLVALVTEGTLLLKDNVDCVVNDTLVSYTRRLWKGIHSLEEMLENDLSRSDFFRKRTTGVTSFDSVNAAQREVSCAILASLDVLEQSRCGVYAAKEHIDNGYPVHTSPYVVRNLYSSLSELLKLLHPTLVPYIPDGLTTDLRHRRETSVEDRGYREKIQYSTWLANHIAKCDSNRRSVV